jgi:hypothetical protein
VCFVLVPDQSTRRVHIKLSSHCLCIVTHEDESAGIVLTRGIITSTPDLSRTATELLSSNIYLLYASSPMSSQPFCPHVPHLDPALPGSS